MDAFFILDLIGTAVFAYTGSVAAKQQRFHLLGVFYISILTAVGGGTLRSVLLQTPDLFWINSSAYLIVVSAVVLTSYVITINTNRLWFYVLDSQSLAVFVALGFSVTLAQGKPLQIAFAMGVLSGIGGGLIRDAVTSQPPQALSDPAYPLMMLAAAAGSLISHQLGLPAWTLSCPAVLMVVFSTMAINYFRFGYLINYDRTGQKHAANLDNNSEHSNTRGQPDGALNGGVGQSPTRGRTRHASKGRKTKSGLMAGVHAAGVIVLSCLAGYYYFNQSITHATSNTPPVTTALTPSASASNTSSLAGNVPADEKNSYNAALQSIKELLAARQISEAEKLISDTQKSRYADQDLTALGTNARNLKAYLRTLDDAEKALAGNDISALEEMLAIASDLGYNDHRFDTLKLSLANAQERETIKAANNNLAKKSFALHLASAEHHFGLGNIDLAIAEIETARSFGIADQKLEQLSLQLASEKQFRSTPLTDSDFAFVAEKFQQLERAIKLKNMKAISTLTTGNSQRKELFSGLFDRYVDLSTSVKPLTANESDKIISSTLVLENMRLPNGNLTYPASSYGEIKLSIERTRQGWSKIKW